MSTNATRRRRRPITQILFVLVVTPALIATNLLGTVPDNPLSAGIRNAVAIMLPTEFNGYLDGLLSKNGLPTLLQAPDITPESTNTPLPPTPTPIPPTITATQTPTPFPPTSTPTMIAITGNYCVNAEALNVRTGPGMGYPAVGWLINNDCITVDGRAEGTLWVRISTGQPGHLDYGGLWIFGGYLLPKDFDRLPAVTPPSR